VVCCHGWTAPLKNVVRDTGLPEKLAAAGFFVLAFDYRGWGESDGMVVANGPLPQAEGDVTMPVRIVRQVFDPVEWVTDIQHAIDFVEGEPGVDPERIGLWGSSLGGGLAVCVAVHDPRVKCVFSQVGGHDYRGSDGFGETFFPIWTRQDMRERAIEQARSPSYPLPQPEGPGRRWPGPVDAGVRYFAPIDFASQIKVPILVLDAEGEHFWDIQKHGVEAFKRIKASSPAPAEYRTVPGMHPEIYRENSAVASDMAVDWFSRHMASS
jgi:dienelactone hydrolase